MAFDLIYCLPINGKLIISLKSPFYKGKELGSWDEELPAYDDAIRSQWVQSPLLKEQEQPFTTTVGSPTTIHASSYSGSYPKTPLYGSSRNSYSSTGHTLFSNYNINNNNNSHVSRTPGTVGLMNLGRILHF